MNDPSQMMNRSFGMWPPPLPPPDDPMGFQNPRPVFASGAGGGAGAAKPGRANWKAKKAAAAADKRRKAAAAAAAAGGGGAVVEGIGGGAVGGGGGGGGGYKPPTLNELQFQNRMKTRRFYPRKYARFAPFAPRNTTSFIIRAKKSGGIAELVSPCPVTPAILPTPKFSPSREGVVDMAKEEWGVDGYGSMKGLIRLRSSPGRGADDDDAAAEDGSSESDVEEHLEVERRLDHDLSRFEMVYPGGAGAGAGAGGVEAYLLESRVDDQDSHIAQLEEENLTLKERLFLMEREMGDLQRRLRLIEKHLNVKNTGSTDGIVGGDNNENEESNRNEVVIEETPENDGGGDVLSEKSGGDCDDGGGSGTPTRE
ncbi:uncharacterized protein LOC109703662 [Ananas comosus]|uniref:Uncharacterized protein LOC109703662 n=1 Tax=Ananas comosus TaxID=4615 RepID=A0A6P5EA95_ANACO|nr:uncharacterized protein LOC109703662 [Ananas comosus]